MNQNVNRVIVTEKGHKLRKEMLKDTPVGTLSFTMARSSSRSRFLPRDQSPSVLSSSRSGYFRPKQITHDILKSQNSTRLYPEYLREDPREYPNKHECVWEPEPIIPGRKKLPVVFPVAKTIHHTFYNPHQHHNSTNNPPIKIYNRVVGGEFGHLPLNMTTCRYPEREPLVLEELNQPDGDDNNLSGRLSTEKKPSSGLTTPTQTPRQPGPKGGKNLKLHLADLLSPSMNDGGMIALRTGSNWLSEARLTGTLSTKSAKTYRTVLGLPEDKVRQIRLRHENNQKTYIGILKRLSKKTKDDLEKKQELPNYLTTFEKKMEEGRKLIEEMAKFKESEEGRFNNALRNAKEKKYEKYWKDVIKSNKTALNQTQQHVSFTQRDNTSKITINREKDESLVRPYNKGTMILDDLEDKKAPNQTLTNINVHAPREIRKNLPKALPF